MDVEVVGRLLSTLPEDDDHPYRTGPWRPQTTEWQADDLQVVDRGVQRAQAEEAERDHSVLDQDGAATVSGHGHAP